MSNSSLIKKLQIKPGQRILVMNPPLGYLDDLGSLSEGVEVTGEAESNLDFVHLFVKDRAELEKLGSIAMRAVKHDGLLWVSYPKRSSKVETDLTRDVGWDYFAQFGLRPVAQASTNDVCWSALRFRPADRISK